MKIIIYTLHKLIHSFFLYESINQPNSWWIDSVLWESSRHADIPNHGFNPTGQAQIFICLDAWPIISLCLSVGPLLCLLQKRVERKNFSMLLLLVCSSNSLNLMPFFSWLKTGTGAQSPRSCTVAFGSATGKGGSCEASVATQGVVDPLVGPPVVRGVTVKPSSPQGCVFLQFPQMDG